MKSLFSLVICLIYSTSLAQLSYKGEFEFRSSLTIVQTDMLDQDQFAMTLRGHLEADYSLSPLTFKLVLDPTAQLNGPLLDHALFEPGLTEAFLLYRLDTADLSLGLERLALEYARLSLPFSLEPSGKTGQKQGLWSARASIYLEDWRLRPAFLYRSQDAQAGAVISLKKAFDDFELEAHGLYLDQAFTLGLGGSGLLGDLIFYGEAWLLTEKTELRGALGLSGFWDDNLWTLEAAYAPNPLTPFGLASAQLLGQISLPHEQNSSLELSTALSMLDPSPNLDASLSGLFNATYQVSELEYSFSSSFGALVSGSSQSYSFNLALTGYF